MSIREEAADGGSCLVQNMAMFFKGDGIQQTALGYVFKNWNQSCGNIRKENVFIRLQIPGLHVNLQGKLHMYNQLHVTVVYKEHRISLDMKLRCGCQP